MVTFQNNALIYHLFSTVENLGAFKTRAAALASALDYYCASKGKTDFKELSEAVVTVPQSLPDMPKYLSFCLSESHETMLNKAKSEVISALQIQHTTNAYVIKLLLLNYLRHLENSGQVTLKQLYDKLTALENDINDIKKILTKKN